MEEPKNEMEHLSGLVEEIVHDNMALFDVLNRVHSEQEQNRASILHEIDLLREEFAGAASFKVLRELCREVAPTISAMEALLVSGDFSDPEIIRGHVASLAISLNAILQRLGAEKIVIDPGVEQFDPNRHLCVRVVTAAESLFPAARARTVVRIVEDGYTAGGKVITPAKVEVQSAV